ncbi:flagellin [Butyrivibrio sp. INlla16]|uniref:flagellin N-terminal helical domain-containing protein n=1 Tax=Butyrivibrio sp. INlla16 TaxID=1520807 RepID=UPI000891A254|nr:flagellin [Butyrivibrio sp. INlla16]SDB60152.1 flagellin [Butyrivibrio sp. INlla16]
MVIQHNLTAMNSNRMLGITTSGQAKSSEKLSSGYKINRAADDAAGLSISEKMRKQMRGLDRASTNADDGVSAVQTAEGALTEVHDMLQRMNELAVQAANGTNSQVDRDAIQNEIAQLTTEIDRVAETTKFNETYLLKGGTGNYNKYMVTHDAGLDGTLADLGSYGTFTCYLKSSDDTKIAGKEYHLYDQSMDTIGYLQAGISAALASTTSVTINGTTYVPAISSYDSQTPVFKVGDQEYSREELQAKVIDGAKVFIPAGTSPGETGSTRVAVDAGLSKNITIASAVEKMNEALKQANLIGVDSNKVNMVQVGCRATTGTATTSGYGERVTAATNDETILTFSIQKGTARVAKDLGLQLHVGSDADMTNKIMMNVQVMNSANLGIQQLQVSDPLGIAATYAIDAIEDALKVVSEQRSELGAIQNRLEHTIKNLDNVVENTTAAESRIRDTDMAEEMVTYSKNNILAQAGQSMLAQANQSTQGVMSLLQG